MVTAMVSSALLFTGCDLEGADDARPSATTPAAERRAAEVAELRADLELLLLPEPTCPRPTPHETFPGEEPAAAADVEDARPLRHEIGDDLEIEADPGRHGGHRVGRRGRTAGMGVGGKRHRSSPLARAAEETKPSMAAKKFGSSKRNASWPRSVSISTKETGAAFTS